MPVPDLIGKIDRYVEAYDHSIELMRGPHPGTGVAKP